MDMDRSFPTPTPPRLEVQVPSGRVTIRAEASDRTDVHVEDDGHDDRWDVDLHPGRAGDGDVIVVRRHNRSGRGLGPEVEITCPLGTSVDAQFASADLSARGVL